MYRSSRLTCFLILVFLSCFAFPNTKVVAGQLQLGQTTVPKTTLVADGTQPVAPTPVITGYSFDTACTPGQQVKVSGQYFGKKGQLRLLGYFPASALPRFHLDKIPVQSKAFTCPFPIRRSFILQSPGGSTFS